MRVLIAGAGGLIGGALIPCLRHDGHEVRRLVRRESRAGDEWQWDPPAGQVAEDSFTGVDAVLNLCGAPLAGGRWSAARKQVITDSRIEPTEVLAEAVAQHEIPVLVNASAVGYYGDTGTKPVDESTPPGAGFLAELCVAWENATAAAQHAGARVVSLRTGLVLAGDGGLLRMLKPLFNCALGGKLGSGAQFMPWVSIHDEVDAIRFALDTQSLHGPITIAAPNPVTNAEFTALLGRTMHRPAPWWIPGVLLRAALGEAADEMALASQRALPTALHAAGIFV